MHGKPKVPWTRLESTVGPFGSSDTEHTIKLTEPVNWEPGDQIVIASTDFDWKQAETFTIKKCTKDTKCIIKGRMKFQHFGEVGNSIFQNFLTSMTKQLNSCAVFLLCFQMSLT